MSTQRTLTIIQGQALDSSTFNYEDNPLIFIRSYPVTLPCSPQAQLDMRDVGAEIDQTRDESSWDGTRYAVTITGEAMLANWIAAHLHTYRISSVADDEQGFLDFFKA